MADANLIIAELTQFIQSQNEKFTSMLSGPNCEDWLISELRLFLNTSNVLEKAEYVAFDNCDFHKPNNESTRTVNITIKQRILGAEDSINTIIDLVIVYSGDEFSYQEKIMSLKERVDSHINTRQLEGSNYNIIALPFVCFRYESLETNISEEKFLIQKNNVSEKMICYFSGEAYSSINQFTWQQLLFNDMVIWSHKHFTVSLAVSPIICAIQEEALPNWMDELDIESEEEAESLNEMEMDLLVAGDVQKGMLKEAPSIEGFETGVEFLSCSEVSGDFYEFIQLEDGKIGFAQGDVSGHGLQAGLIMGMAKKVLAIYAVQGQSPAIVLKQVNDSLVDDLSGKMFVSITYGILDPKESKITWARAGHNPSVVYNHSENKVETKRPPGMVVGLKKGSLFDNIIKIEETYLNKGDIFLLYTDGLTETMNRQGEAYGEEQLNYLIEDTNCSNLDELLSRIMDSNRGFRGSSDIADDISLLAIRKI